MGIFFLRTFRLKFAKGRTVTLQVIAPISSKWKHGEEGKRRIQGWQEFPLYKEEISQEWLIKGDCL